MPEINKIIDKIAAKQHLSQEDAGRAFQIMMMGGATPVQMAALLMGLKINGETVDEITGAANALRMKMQNITIPEHLQDVIIDTCGTGGDSKNTYNISTTVGFVLAGCGIPVAKHGNRSISSKSGSSDVLQALGVDIDVEEQTVIKCLEEANFCFLMAPKYHAAMRHVAPVRQELAMRTIFNLLGPLINPAQPKRQILGVYSKDWVEPLAHVLKNLGTESAWVIHGMDGMDEISLMDETYVAELKDGEVKTFTIKPEDYGFERLEDIEPLLGGQSHINAKALRTVLTGEEGAYRDVVLLNSAAGIVIAGKADNFSQAIELAKQSIDSGAATNALNKLVEISNLDKVESIND